ncbi:Septum site-determining protein MinC [BD1-7 clade bacterium]|uniref:Probable septum site-determining protein MinC n=1 Tax=BD1-7 clade bacterium TaxID=2029982 RepID=A0A5S9NUU7_9GAMM|nr:Septum site-determining protein MinC [BD1-7 clade bacterium]
MADECFALKGSVVTTIIIELHTFDPADFVQLLQQKIEQAPSFFHQSPVIIDLSVISDISADALRQIICLCEDSGLQPIGFKGEQHATSVAETPLALLSDTATRAKSVKPASVADTSSEPSDKTTASEDSAPTEEEPSAAAVVSRPTKVIEQPVRSGQQVYAADANLVVLGNVSEGAEVLADGDIHVYGALRGRALAGVRGDATARIFCQQLNAELLSIAGNFILSDSIDPSHNKSAVQVALSEQSLQVKSLY